MSQFSELFVAVEKLFDREFGVQITVIPMTNSQMFTGSPDIDNPPYTVTAIIDDEGRILLRRNNSRNNDVDARFSGGGSVVSFFSSQFCPAQPEPQKGWILEISGKRFSVSYIRRDGEGCIHAHVESV